MKGSSFSGSLLEADALCLRCVACGTAPALPRASYACCGKENNVTAVHTKGHVNQAATHVPLKPSVVLHGRNSWQMAEELKPLMMELDKNVPVITSHSLVGMTAVACGFK